MLARNKASLRLENKPLDQLPAHDRLLVLLKSAGPASTADLAAKLGITGEAARQQLLLMQQEGLVESSSQAHGRGRPRQLWSLTPAANRRFPDSHAQLTAQLLQTICKTFGEPALDQLIEARAGELLDKYTVALKGATGLADRLERLVSLRNAEGYMAECRSEKGGYLFIENHCPICAATGVCQKLCRSELDLFGKVLGPQVRVDREEFMINGSRRCVYRIRRNSALRRPASGAKPEEKN